MLGRSSSKTRLLATAALLGGSLLLTACDQRDERVDRAQTVIDAAMDQINGRTITEPGSPQTMEDVDVLDRAIAGTIRNDLNVQVASERSLIAIGSIIAKPKDIPQAPTIAEGTDPVIDAPQAMEMRTPEMSAPDVPSQPTVTEGDLTVVPARAMPRVKLDPKERERTLRDISKAEQEMQRVAREEPMILRSMPVISEPQLADGGGDTPAARQPEMAPPEAVQAMPMQTRSLQRREAITEQAIVKQRDAQSVMLDTMAKYNLGGEVALSRGGQMVIQIGADGADPTRFSPQEVGSAPANTPTDETAAPTVDFIVQEVGNCPDGEDLAMIQANPLWATECIIEDLMASGQFEYVEKDFIFQNQFVRRPPADQPPTEPVTGPTPGTDQTGQDSGTNSGPGTPVTPVGPATITPNDPLWALQWHFRDNGSEDGQSEGGAGFQDFWSRTAQTGSGEVVVAVVDTGLQMDHPDIASSPNVAPGWDMVSDPRMGNDGDGRDSDANDPGDLCDPSVPFSEDSFHGTHVAGTVGAAATNNGSGVAGGAWNVKIVPVRALGKCGGRLSDINDGIRWAAGLIPAEDPDGNEVWNENPADIINLSIGLFEFCPASLQDAIDSAVERGVVVVSAAGNARISTRFYAPGGCQNVISVAAGDARGQITPYSNFGAEVDVLAPGGDLMRDDNGDGRPDGVLSTKVASNCYDPITGEGVDSCFYAYEQGTSMAAPHVSAALALLKSKSPGLTGEELTQALLGALDPREDAQCAGDCDLYPGAEPIEGSDNLCRRPCGGGLLNLANLADEPVGTASGGSQ